MFSKESLDNLILSKRTVLCVGLDTDPAKIPAHITGTTKQKVMEFNTSIIKATHKYCVAYKINVAFYEALGMEGWQILFHTAEYIKSHYPQHFLIADAKRGDIGNTAERYAKAFYDEMPFDAITLSPYMGIDTVAPFIRRGKFAIVLALTSNTGASDFQLQPMDDGKPLYQKVIEKFSEKFGRDEIMFVTGATHSPMLKSVRSLVPDYYLLIPGVGAQGADYLTTLSNALNASGAGVLINSSREILYASSNDDFEEAAAAAASKYEF
ncbi:orotidine 5'-phosphate decarboxylase [Thermaurantimonas aggregans]|uniref:Orotidine-5'-phosphate decarboxylase n=1 Tax=Thermaurantimonas aggregans TaxID=2173829 RepID=A0A401XJR3_9FLAO|nr:orotidine-5'-phosphate decarboxylase [Thermaurantimonas aggregans]MCX8148910.1 orotidine-5'-phosphate decarboxylase [Thermaurantimonas aggregans]GCD77275.1 orotidine 5'-phosphate decarboxylase [Thermaurantimonas aggregans]